MIINDSAYLQELRVEKSIFPSISIPRTLLIELKKHNWWEIGYFVDGSSGVFTNTCILFWFFSFHQED